MTSPLTPLTLEEGKELAKIQLGPNGDCWIDYNYFGKYHIGYKFEDGTRWFFFTIFRYVTLASADTIEETLDGVERGYKVWLSKKEYHDAEALKEKLRLEKLTLKHRLILKENQNK